MDKHRLGIRWFFQETVSLEAAQRWRPRTTTLLSTQAMVGLSQVTTSQPSPACSIVLLENTVLVPGPGKETNQTQSAIASGPSDSQCFQHSVGMLPDHFGWYRWTAWCSDCPCTCPIIERQAGTSSHVLKQRCKTCHQMSPQLLLLPPQSLCPVLPDFSHYWQTAFLLSTYKAGRKKNLYPINLTQQQGLGTTFKIRRFYGEILLQQQGIGLKGPGDASCCCVPAGIWQATRESCSLQGSTVCKKYRFPALKVALVMISPHQPCHKNV